MPQLRLEDISKRFGGLQAVSDVSFVVPPGEITGLIGPNGAGKTTVVNMITGVLKLSKGRILMDDHDLSHAPMEEVARQGVIRTFQNIRLLKDASVSDNVAVGFHRTERASGLAKFLATPSATAERRAIRRSVSELLDRFGMTQFGDYPVSALSYGHQRRVEMMRALAAEPTVLVLDEPVAGMNDAEAYELGDIFRSLADAGMAILLIEHNMRFVTSYCSTLHVLDAGRMIASGNTADVINDPAVIAAYLGS